MCVSAEEGQQRVSWAGGEEKRRLEIGLAQGLGQVQGAETEGKERRVGLLSRRMCECNCTV